MSGMNRAFDLADIRADNGDTAAAQTIRYCAATAETYQRYAKDLAWACLQKNASKRKNVVLRILMEMDANGESTAYFPMKDYCR